MNAALRNWMVHGGRLSDARAAYGHPADAWLDLSTGINPHPWPHAEMPAIDWAALPDERGLAELENAAATYLGVDPAFVCAVPGTEIGLRLLRQVLPADAAHIAPAYRTYGAMTDGPAMAVADLLKVEDRSVILANPNNPDGVTISRAALLDRIARPDHWLVVDEAFADVHLGLSVATEAGDMRRLIVFRSFGKFFGLAGVRLGFIVGPTDMIGRYRDMLGSWPVSAAAIAIGTAAYRDTEWIDTMRRRLRQDAAALDAMLARHGLHASGHCPLFRLVEVDDAASLFDRLARRAILTRPFDYAPRWLRIGLPKDEAGLARLDAALRDG